MLQSQPSAQAERGEIPLKRRAWVAAITCCAVGLVIAFHPTLLSGLDRVQEELGDTRLVQWLLEHNWRWVVGDPQHRRYFDPPMFFPAVNTLAYSESMLGSAPLYFVWRGLGLASDTSFQLWQLAVSVLNFAAAILFLREGLRLGPWSAAAGAAIFAFAGTRIAQLGHSQLLPHFGLPLFAFAVIRFSDEAETKRGRWVALGALALADQVYAGFYLGWFLGFGALVVLGWSIALRRTRSGVLLRLKSSWRSVAIGAFASSLALSPLAYHYWLISRELGTRSFSEVFLGIPRFASWVRMSGVSWLYGWSAQWADHFLPPGMGYEHTLGYGFITSALAVWGLVARRRQTPFRLLGLSAATLFVLALVPFGDFTLWRLVYLVVPGANALRGVARVGLALLLPAAAGVAACLDTLEKRRLGPLLGLTILAVLIEQGQNAGSFNKERNRADVRWLAQRVPAECTSFLFTPVNGANGWYKYEVDALWASMERGIPTLNGYSGHCPKGYLLCGVNAIHRNADRERVAESLRVWTEEHRLNFPLRCWIAEVPGDSSGSATAR
jgi:hypothetical protein